MSKASTQAEVVERATQDWAGAELRRDVPFLDKTLSEDFSAVGPRGFLLNKAQWLDRYRSGALENDSFAWEAPAVRLYGDSAVVTGLQSSAGRHQGNPVGGQFRVTQTWVKDAEQWRLAAIHLSEVVAMAGSP